MGGKFLKSLAGFFIALAVITSLTAVTSFAANEKLSKTSVTITEGETETLTASGVSDTVTWSTADKSIATVSKGVIKGIAPGTTTITAMVGTKKLNCKVTVLTDKIVPKASNVSITAGKTGSIGIAIKGVNDVAYGTTDKSVATAKLDVKGGKLNITGVKEGTAKIKVYSKSDSSISRTITVNVKKAPVTSKSDIRGKVTNDVYRNDVLKMQFKMDGFVFADASLLEQEQSDVILVGITPDVGILTVECVDVSVFGDTIDEDLYTSEDFLSPVIDKFVTDFAGDDDVKIEKIKTQRIDIAGIEYLVITYSLDESTSDSLYLTAAIGKNKSNLIVMQYICQFDDFSTVAKHFTAIK